MAQVQKIVLSSSRDIPFNKLLLSQSNVRQIKAGVSIEELAEDIARRTPLQSLTVRPVCDADGNETGMFEIPAGGRRYRALELLVKQKRLAKTAPIPCVVREGGIAEEDSLAENVQRAPLHPLDQFRAFLTLREKGQSEEEIAAAFFVGGLRREAAPAPGFGLAQAARRLCRGRHHPRPAHGLHRQRRPRASGAGIRAAPPILLEGAARHSAHADRRRRPRRRQARPVRRRRRLPRSPAASSCATCSRATTAAGFRMSLCSTGWSRNSSTDRAEAIRAEGWKWIEVAPDFAYGHTYGLRQLRGEQVAAHRRGTGRRATPCRPR